MSVTTSMPWFRMYAEFLNDPKIVSLAFEDQRHFVGVLALKCAGALDDVPDADLLDRIVAQRLWIDHAIIRDVKKRLVAARLIDESWQPLAWSKRQFSSDRDSTAAARKRRQRAREKAEAEANDDVTDGSRVTVTAMSHVPPCHRHGAVTRLDTDTDTDTEVIPNGITGAGAPENSYSPENHQTAKPARAKSDRTVGLRELIADGVDRDHARDWLKVRAAKRAPLTPTAWEDIKAEATKAGITPGEAVRISATNCWQGFKASWMDKQGPAAGGLSVQPAGVPPGHHWATTWSGIVAKGAELGLVQEEGELAPMFKQRVMAAANLSEEERSRLRADHGVAA